MAQLDLIEFRIAEFFPTARDEMDFFVTLERLDPALPFAERHALQKASLPVGLDDAAPTAPRKGLRSRLKSAIKRRLR